MKLYFFIVGLIVLAVSCDSPGKAEHSQAIAVCISDPARLATSVYLTSDEKNNPVISWCETDDTGKKSFYLSFFDTVEAKFSSPVNIPVEQTVSFHEEGMPKIAVKGDGSIVAIYETPSPTEKNKYAGNVRYVQSHDKGKSWSEPLCVHTDTAAGKSRSFASLARLSNGEVGACWLDVALDYKKEGRPVKFASTKGSNGFTNEVVIDSVACQCCRTAISSADNGIVSVLYRDILNDSIRDISVSSSIDNGQSFNEPVTFSGDNWNINGCPHNGPGVVSVGKVTYATWFTGGSQKGVWYAELDKEKNVRLKKHISANGRNIQLCVLPTGERILASNENVRQLDSFYSKIVVNKITDQNVWTMDITSSTAHASYPVIKSFGANKVVVAWVEQNKIFYTLVDAGKIKTEAQQPSNLTAYKKVFNPDGKLANRRDPVCRMHVSNDVQDVSIVNNKKIGFCSEHCKEKFLRSPAEYKVE